MCIAFRNAALRTTWSSNARTQPRVKEELGIARRDGTKAGAGAWRRAHPRFPRPRFASPPCPRFPASSAKARALCSHSHGASPRCGVARRPHGRTETIVWYISKPSALAHLRTGRRDGGAKAGRRPPRAAIRGHRAVPPGPGSVALLQPFARCVNVVARLAVGAFFGQGPVRIVAMGVDARAPHVVFTSRACPAPVARHASRPASARGVGKVVHGARPPRATLVAVLSKKCNGR